MSYSRFIPNYSLRERCNGIYAWLWSRFTVHHTPKHGSWLNQAEIEIGLFSRQCLGKRRIASLDELTTEATAWNQRTNHAKTTIEWKFTRHKARLKLKYKMMRS